MYQLTFCRDGSKTQQNMAVLIPLEVRVRAPRIIPKVYHCFCIVHMIHFQSLPEAIMYIAMYGLYYSGKEKWPWPGVRHYKFLST